MRRLLISFLLLFACISSFAQKMMKYLTVEQIDESFVMYYYNYTHSEKGDKQVVPMLLQVGHDVQKFTCLYDYNSDSLALVFDNQPQDTRFTLNKVNEIRRKPGCRIEVSWVLYTNYPEGKQSITDRVFLDKFISEEEITIPDWSLVDERKTIGGYECHKAVAKLYGRVWTAWYTRKIERPDGPWLLKGLPGLVVLAEDDSGGYKFELQRIEHRKTPIVFNPKNYFKSKRETVLKAQKKFYDDMAQYAKNTEIGKQTSDMPQTPRRPYYPLRKISK